MRPLRAPTMIHRPEVKRLRTEGAPDGGRASDRYQQIIIYEVSDPVATITLNRPKA